MWLPERLMVFRFRETRPSIMSVASHNVDLREALSRRAAKVAFDLLQVLIVLVFLAFLDVPGNGFLHRKCEGAVRTLRNLKVVEPPKTSC